MQVKAVVKTVDNSNISKSKSANTAGSKEEMFKKLLDSKVQSSKPEKISENSKTAKGKEESSIAKDSEVKETKDPEAIEVKVEEVSVDKEVSPNKLQDLLLLLVQLLQVNSKEINTETSVNDVNNVNQEPLDINLNELMSVISSLKVSENNVSEADKKVLSALENLLQTSLNDQEIPDLENLVKAITNDATSSKDNSLEDIKTLINKFLSSSESINNEEGQVEKLKDITVDHFTLQNVAEEKEEPKIIAAVENKEEKLLNSLVKGNDESKNNKINMFMQNITRFSSDAEKLNSVENVVVNRNTFNADMVKAIKYMELNNIKELTVKLYPKELGQITIKLTMDAGIMKANLSTNNKDTYNLLHANMKELNENLANSQFRVNEVTINIYSEDTTFFKQQGFSDNQNSEGQNGNSNGRNSSKSEEDSLTIEQLNINANQKDKLLHSNVSILA